MDMMKYLIGDEGEEDKSLLGGLIRPKFHVRTAPEPLI